MSENIGESAISTESSDIENFEGEETIPSEIPAVEKKRINSLKIKFNNKEYEEKLPFEIDEEHAEWMKNQIQKAKLSASKSEQYANLEKDSNLLKQDIQAFFQELKSNPKKALQNPLVGIDIKMLAAEILEEELAEQEKSPDQRERDKLQARLAQLEEERAKEKADAENAKYQATLESAYARYDQALESSLSKNPDLPQTPYIVEKMTKYMAYMVEEGYEPDMDLITNQVRDEMNNDIKHLLNIMPADQVEKILGKEVLGKLRKNRLAKATKTPPAPLKSTIRDVNVKAPKTEEKPKERTTTMKDFFGV